MQSGGCIERAEVCSRDYERLFNGKMIDVYEDVLAICNEIIAASANISGRDIIPKEPLLSILENFHIVGRTGERLGVRLD